MSTVSNDSSTLVLSFNVGETKAFLHICPSSDCPTTAKVFLAASRTYEERKGESLRALPQYTEYRYTEHLAGNASADWDAVGAWAQEKLKEVLPNAKFTTG